MAEGGGADASLLSAYCVQPSKASWGLPSPTLKLSPAMAGDPTVMSRGRSVDVPLLSAYCVQPPQEALEHFLFQCSQP